MDAKTKARMEAKARESVYYANVSLATGGCTFEGDEFSCAVFEYDRLAALDLARAGYLGKYAQAHANSKNLKKQKDVADFLANPDAARAAGVIVKPDVTEQQLGKAEFHVRRERGVEEIMAEEVMLRTDAQKEWMQRQAETESGFKRDDPNPERRAMQKRKYRNLCNRDRK